MGLTRYAVVFGLGYAFGDPDGRRRLLGLRGQVAELSRRPEVKRVQERAWDVAGDTALAARNRLTARSRRAAAEGAGSDTAGTGTTGAATTGTGTTGAATAGTATTGTGTTADSSGGTGTSATSGGRRFRWVRLRRRTRAGAPTATPPADVTPIETGAGDTGAVAEELGGTTVVEDSRAALLGTSVPARPVESETDRS